MSRNKKTPCLMAQGFGTFGVMFKLMRCPHPFREGYDGRSLGGRPGLLAGIIWPMAYSKLGSIRYMA